MQCKRELNMLNKNILIMYQLKNQNGYQLKDKNKYQSKELNMLRDNIKNR